MLLSRSLFDDYVLSDLFELSQNLRNYFDSSGHYSSTSYPSLNVYEDEDNYYVTAELPRC